MKTIYNAVIGQLSGLLPTTVRWIDWDKGQLKKIGKDDRPDVSLPCLLIGISIPQSKDITYTSQSCKATITIKLAFDVNLTNRTSGNAPQEARDKALEPYDLIAEVYKRLQGFGTVNFTPFSRTSQGEEQHNTLFVYRQSFTCEFEDLTAEE
ncbi:hypothetical protein [Dysgonomonas sp. ZJ709]|uniref:hypothetical protein n=1 Tax=Dysgonomonas sp. ZJ709 TaxID=2709797 RepID=UPI0013EDFEF5|nr:hypothetical protein [Dysgonomonas sp. ZJ709]